MRLMKRIREAIQNECFDKFVINFVKNYYKKGEDDAKDDDENGGESNIPNWVIEALEAVNVKF